MIKWWLQICLLYLYILNIHGAEKYRNLNYQSVKSQLRYFVQCPLAQSNDEEISFYQQLENSKKWMILTPLPEYPDVFEVIQSEVVNGSVFKCIANKTDGTKERAMVFVNTMNPDIQKLNYTIQDLLVKETDLGSSVTLNCLSKSTNSDDKFYWFNPDLWQLNTTSATYTIEKMTESDFGAYYCASYDQFDVENKVLSVQKIFVKSKTSKYVADFSTQADSLTLTQPTYPLNNPIYFVPRQAKNISQRVIWEQPAFNVLLHQSGRVFIKEAMEKELTKNEFFYRITDRNDPKVIISEAALFRTAQMGRNPFNIILDPSMVDVINKSKIELKCINSEDRLVEWTFVPTGSSKSQALPDGTDIRDDGRKGVSILRIKVADIYHSGTYICDGKRGKDQATVVVRPTPKLQISPSTITLNPYGSGTFTCQLIGASGKLLWRRVDGQSFQEGVEFVYGSDTQSTLRISSPHLSMNGSKYQCSFRDITATSLLLIHNCFNGFRQCGDGTCIKDELFCNGVKDCSDGSDETEAACNYCEPNKKRCKVHNGIKPRSKCIMAHWVCDGENDCGNSYDEQNCTKFDKNYCYNSHFLCNDNSTILPRSYWCDKSKNCPNGEDEFNCQKPSIIKPTNPTQLIVQKKSSVSLTCEVASNPTATVVWRFNWGRLPENLNYTIKTIGKNCKKITNVLTINDIDPKFGGIYSCEAISIGSAMAPDYTISVSAGSICTAPFFNDNARTIRNCQRCWCSNVTSDCKSAMGYYQSPIPRLSNPTDMKLMSYKSLKTLENKNTNELYNKNRNIFKFPQNVYTNNPNVFIGSSFGFPKNWITSYGFSMTVPIKLTGSLSYRMSGPIIILESNKLRTALYWCPERNVVQIFIGPSGQANKLSVILSEHDSWYTDSDCSTKATRHDFMNALIDIKLVMVRLKYFEEQTEMEMKPIILNYAIRSEKTIYTPYKLYVPNIEQCSCSYPYSGLSCEKCAIGYTRTDDNKCIIKCAISCEKCNSEGQCIKCQGNRSGSRCLQCKSGFYRMAGAKIDQDCVACPCNNGSALTNNECIRDLKGTGQVKCKCTGNEVNDKSCDKCLQQPIPESIKDLCANRTKKPENKMCNQHGTMSIDSTSNACKCKTGYKGDYCQDCDTEYFNFNSQCLKCSCSNTSSTCTSNNLKFSRITLKSTDPVINPELAVRKLEGLQNVDMQSNYVLINRTTNTVIVKASPIDQGIVFLTLNVARKQNVDTQNMNEYIRMYGGKLSFTFEYFVKNLNGLVYADVTPFLEISSLKLGRIWTPMPFNPETRSFELIISEYGVSWNRVGNGDQKISRELFIRYLLTADKLAVAFPVSPSTEQVKLVDIQMDMADKDGNGDAAPLETCVSCPPGLSGGFCQACSDKSKPVKLRLDPGLPDFECVSCVGNNCACPSGSYKYDFINNKKYKTCQIGIETSPKGRVFFVNAGESLRIPSRSKSFKGGTAVHKWEKLDQPGGKVIKTFESLNTTRKLLDDGRSELTLNLINASVLDGGWYRARARNVYANAEETFKIVVNPNQPPRVKATTSKPVIIGGQTDFNIKIETGGDKNVNVSWKIVKDGKIVDVKKGQIEVIKKPGGEYTVRVKMPGNSTGNYQLKTIVTGTRPTNPFYYEITKNIPKDPTSGPSKPTITVDKPELKLKFMDSGKVIVKTGMNKKTEMKWYKINPKTNKKEPLPTGMTGNTRDNGDHEISVYAANDDHNGKFIGIIIDAETGKEIGKVTVKVSVAGMKPVTKHELKPKSGGGDSSTSGGDSSTSGGDSSTSGGDSSTSGGDSSTSGGDSSTSGGDSSTSGGDSSTSGGDSSTSGGDSSKTKDKDGSISSSEVVTPSEDGTFNNITVPGFIPSTKYCKNQTWYIVNKKKNTKIDITYYVVRTSDNETKINYPVKSGEIIQFKTTVIPEDDNKGVIEFKIDYKYPIIKIKPELSKTSVFPTKLKCSDLNTDFPSNVTWYFNGKIVNKMFLSDNGETINWIDNGKFKPNLHEGNYECRVKNKYNSARKQVYIPDYKNPNKENKKFPSKLSISSSTHDIQTKDGKTTVGVRENEKIELTASLDGNPNVTLDKAATITWILDNSTMVKPTETGKYYSTLVITDTKMKPNRTKLTYKVSVLLQNGTEITKTVVVNIEPQDYRIKVSGTTGDDKISVFEGHMKTIRCTLVDKSGTPVYNAKAEWIIQNQLGGPVLGKKELQQYNTTINEGTVNISLATRNLNDYVAKCQVIYENKKYSSEIIKFDVNQRRFKPSIQLIGLTKNKYVEGIEGDAKSVECKAYDSVSKQELPNVQYKWKIEGSKKNWMAVSINENRIIFGGLLVQPANQSAQVSCEAKYFNRNLVSKKFTFIIKPKSAEKLPKIKLQVIYDPKKPPYPVKVVVTNEITAFPSGINVKISNTNFPKNLTKHEKNRLVIDFTNNGSSQFNPYFHAGRYDFSITNEYGIVYKSVILPTYKNPNVNYTVKLVMYTEDMKEINGSQVRVKEGSRFKGICVYYGHPYPSRITLIYNTTRVNKGISLTHTDYWLSFDIEKFVNSTHSTKYLCNAMTIQRGVYKSVYLFGYDYGYKIVILNKDNQPIQSKNSQQGSDLEYKYLVYDKFTGKTLDITNGTWEIKFNPKDPYVSIDSVLKNKTLAITVDTSDNQLKMKDITYSGYIAIRASISNGTHDISSKPVVLTVKKNKALWPKLEYSITNDNNTYPMKIIVGDKQTKVLATLNYTLVGVRNSSNSIMIEDKQITVLWSKYRFEPYNDAGMYVFVATNKYGTDKLELKLPEFTKVDGNGKVTIDVYSDNKIRNGKEYKIVLDTDSKDNSSMVKVVCNYFDGPKPELIRFYGRSYKNIETGPNDLYVTSSIYGYTKKEDDGTYLCKARLKNGRIVTDEINISGILRGIHLIIKTDSPNDSGSTINLKMGSRKSLKVIATDTVTKERVTDVTPEWIFTVLTNGTKITTTLKDELWKTNPDASLLKHITQDKNGDLTINKVVKSNVIDVRCQVQKEMPGNVKYNYSSKSYSFVTTNDDKKSPKLSITKTINSNNGLLVQLQCSDKLPHKSVVTFKKLYPALGDEVQVERKNNSVTFKFPSNSSNPLLYFGNYECSAESDYGTSKTRLNVVYKRLYRPLEMHLQSSFVNLTNTDDLGNKRVNIKLKVKHVEFECVYTSDYTVYEANWVYKNSTDNSETVITNDIVQNYYAYKSQGNVVNLVLKAYEKEQRDLFVCKVKNGTEVAMSRTLLVTALSMDVGVRVTVKGLTSSNSLNVKRGSNYELTGFAEDLRTGTDITGKVNFMWMIKTSDSNYTKINSDDTKFAEKIVIRNNKLVITGIKQGEGQQVMTGKCVVNLNSTVYESDEFKIEVNDDADKRPELKMEMVINKNNPDFPPVSIDCQSSKSDSLTITRRNGQSISSDMIKRRKNGVTLTFKQDPRLYPRYEGYYQCKAKNKYGTKTESKYADYLTPMSVRLNTTNHIVYNAKDGNRTIHARSNRNVELDCYFTGEDYVEKRCYEIVTGLKADIPIPTKTTEIKLEGNRNPTIYNVTKNHYKIVYKAYDISRPVLVRCIAKTKERKEISQMKIKHFYDLYQSSIYFNGKVVPSHNVYTEFPFYLECKLNKQDKNIKIHKVIWKFSNTFGEVKLKDLAEKVKVDGTRLSFEGFKRFENETIVMCIAYSNSTYDTPSKQLTLKFKEYPVVTNLKFFMEGPNSGYINQSMNYIDYYSNTTVNFIPSFDYNSDKKFLTTEWFKCDDMECKNKKLMNREHLTFKRGTTEPIDAGRYMYLAQITVKYLQYKKKTSTSKSIIIERFGSPEINKTVTKYLYENQNLVLDCPDDKSQPPSNATWEYTSNLSKQKEPLPETSKLYSRGRNYFLFIQAKKLDFQAVNGTFVCSLKNKFGSGMVRYEIKKGILTTSTPAATTNSTTTLKN